MLWQADSCRTLLHGGCCWLTTYGLNTVHGSVIVGGACDSEMVIKADRKTPLVSNQGEGIGDRGWRRGEILERGGAESRGRRGAVCVDYEEVYVYT